MVTATLAITNKNITARKKAKNKKQITKEKVYNKIFTAKKSKKYYIEKCIVNYGVMSYIWQKQREN